MITLIGLAMLTLSVLPNNSASSILSIAAAASATSSNSTKAKPRCASVSKSSGIVMSKVNICKKNHEKSL